MGVLDNSAVLVVIEGPNVGEVYPIDEDHFVMGRQDDCQLCDIFHGHHSVSRQHAKIQRKKQQYIIEDLKSRNGSYLNGSRLSKPVELRDGDRLNICHVTFEFSLSPESVYELRRAAQAESLHQSVVFDQKQSPHINSVIALPKDGSRYEIGTAAHADRKLKSLIRLLADLGESLDAGEIINQLIVGLFDVFPVADRGFVALKDHDGELIPRAVRHRSHDGESTTHVSQTLIDRVMGNCEAILSADALADARFRKSQSLVAEKVRSLMCVPVVDRTGNVLGIIQLDTTSGRGEFNEQDLEVLVSITPHIGTSLDYARLHAEEIEIKTLERDLSLARRVQATLLPQEAPDLAGYEFHAYYEAARQVGGDYYGYAIMPNGNLAVAVADVTGKGVPAALLMAKIAGEWKYLLSSNTSPTDAVRSMNESLLVTSSTNQFVTLSVAVVDPVTHELTVVNAGHPSPLLRSATGAVSEIGRKSGGVPLGMFEDEEYTADAVQLEPGDSVLMYTDGLSEAEHPAHGLFGLQRVQQQLATNSETAKELIESMIQSVRQFVSGQPQSDDMCLTCIRRF